jgi:hypothetical protein
MPDEMNVIQCHLADERIQVCCELLNGISALGMLRLAKATHIGGVDRASGRWILEYGKPPPPGGNIAMHKNHGALPVAGSLIVNFYIG